MLTLLFAGVTLGGLFLLSRKTRIPSKNWDNYEEWRNYEQEKQRWKDTDLWALP